MPVVGRDPQSVIADDSHPKVIICTAGDTLYYGSSAVSSGTNDGSLSVGQSVEVEHTTFVVSASTSRYEMRSAVSSAASDGQDIIIDVTKPPYNVVADNVTDCYAGLQQAVNDAVVALPAYGSVPNDQGARIVQLPPGKIKYVGVLDVPANVVLQGHGKTATWLTRSTTVLTGPAVQCLSTGVNQGFRDFGIINNDFDTDCLHLHCGLGASILGDAMPTVEDVCLVGGRDGVLSGGGGLQANELRMSRVFAIRNHRHGFWISTTDFFLEHCTSAQAGTGTEYADLTSVYGFLLMGNNGRVTGCKAYGQNGIYGAGFNIADRNQVTNCEAQDCEAHGFMAGSNGGVIQISNCLADSCAQIGFRISGGVMLSNCAAVTRGSGLYTTAFGIAIVSDVPGLIHVLGFRTQAVTQLFGNTTVFPIGGTYDIENRFGAQSLDYAATLATNPWLGADVKVGTLTGPITVSQPTVPPNGITNVPHGMRLTYQFTQDATGGRAVTFNAVFKTTAAIPTTANTTTRIAFVHDGTNWREESRSTI